MKKADRFRSSKQIEKVEIKNLKATTISRHKSNKIVILDIILDS